MPPPELMKNRGQTTPSPTPLQTDFPTWYKRIGSFLEGGQSFKTEDELGVYALFPSFWRVRPMQRARISFLSKIV